MTINVQGGIFAANEIAEEANAAATALLSCCEYYEYCLRCAAEQGDKWVYTNSNKYAPQATTFDEMLTSGRHGANCAMPASWALMDIGAIPAGMRFWGGRDGEFARRENVQPYLDLCCDVSETADENVTFADLYENGKVKAGDIFLCSGHTFIYRGNESFFAAGHDGRWHTDMSADTEDANHAVFESWIMPMRSCLNYNFKVNFILRLRDDYIPKTCRNAQGVVVCLQ